MPSLNQSSSSQYLRMNWYQLFQLNVSEVQNLISHQGRKIAMLKLEQEVLASTPVFS